MWGTWIEIFVSQEKLNVFQHGGDWLAECDLDPKVRKMSRPFMTNELSMRCSRWSVTHFNRTSVSSSASGKSGPREDHAPLERGPRYLTQKQDHALKEDHAIIPPAERTTPSYPPRRGPRPAWEQCWEAAFDTCGVILTWSYYKQCQSTRRDTLTIMWQRGVIICLRPA